MADLKNDQHYVFRSYIKAWTDDRNEVWIHKRGNAKIIKRGPKGILYENRFYELKKMNQDEAFFIDLCMDAFKMGATTKRLMWEHISAYLLPFSNQDTVAVLKAMNQIPKTNHLSEEINEAFQKFDDIIEEAIVNTEEDFHSSYETDGSAWIKQIINGDVSFYYPKVKDNETYNYAERNEFLFFLCTQYFRTLEMHEIMLSNIKNMIESSKKIKERKFDRKNIHSENILPHMIWILQAKCAAALVSMNAHMTVIHNKTSLPFITSDQPIINLKAVVGKNPTEFVLYYPVSPDIAITVNDSSRIREKDIDKKHIIDNYNQKMMEHYKTYLISNKKEVLQGMIEMYEDS